MARRSRADRGSAVAKVRVYELAKEFGVESKAVMAKLQEMGEFVRSASSTIEAPVVRRLKEAFSAQAGKGQEKRQAGRSGAAAAAGPSGGNGRAPATATAPAPAAAEPASPAARREEPAPGPVAPAAPAATSAPPEPATERAEADTGRSGPATP